MRRTVTIAVLLIGVLGVASAQNTPTMQSTPIAPTPSVNQQAGAQRVIAMLQAQRNAAMDAHAFAEARVSELTDHVEQLTAEIQKLRAALAATKTK